MKTGECLLAVGAALLAYHLWRERGRKTLPTIPPDIGPHPLPWVTKTTVTLAQRHSLMRSR